MSNRMSIGWVQKSGNGY